MDFKGARSRIGASLNWFQFIYRNQTASDPRLYAASSPYPSGMDTLCHKGYTFQVNHGIRVMTIPDCAAIQPPPIARYIWTELGACGLISIAIAREGALQIN